MNRLWVRLSLMIGGVLFFVFFMQFLSIMLIPDPEPGQLAAEGAPDSRPDFEDDHADVPRRLVEFAIFSLLVGLGGGIVIGRVVSGPISDLAAAARRIGQGDLKARVTGRGSRELQELAQTFNAMAEELQRAETLRRNLMADVSHELRTPLTVLEGNLRAALDRVYTLDEAEIANLYSQTRHLIRLVNDLRELALAEAHQLPLETQPLNLNELLSDSLQALEPLAAESGVRLVDELPALPPLTADPIRLRQVLFNLLTNALRHTPPGGHVIVRGHHAANHISLTVTDTGEGLSPEQLLAVFDRFYRADTSRSRETGGTGLGLAIAKAIVEAHGGHVAANSAGPGLGSAFTITLPLNSVL